MGRNTELHAGISVCSAGYRPNVLYCSSDRAYNPGGSSVRCPKRHRGSAEAALGLHSAGQPRQLLIAALVPNLANHLLFTTHEVSAGGASLLVGIGRGGEITLESPAAEVDRHR